MDRQDELREKVEEFQKEFEVILNLCCLEASISNQK